jgi:hypothetical protein
VFHVVLASFAVAGLALAWIGAAGSLNPPKAPVEPNKNRTDNSNDAPKPRNPATVSALGGRISLWSTLVQMPVGIWIVLALPDVQAERILLGNPLFISAVIVALGLMHQLAMLALGDVTKRRLSVSTILLMAVVLLMTAALEVSRPV